jgi:hypothetical protein
MLSDRERTPRIEVRIFENGEVVHVGRFDDLETAEAFADEWTERVLGARAEFEELSGRSLDEIVEADTAIAEDYPHA